jgi:hypothetical protein
MDTNKDLLRFAKFVNHVELYMSLLPDLNDEEGFLLKESQEIKKDLYRLLKSMRDSN